MSNPLEHFTPTDWALLVIMAIVYILALVLCEWHLRKSREETLSHEELDDILAEVEPMPIEINDKHHNRERKDKP
jgi:cytochrome oxidase assembly protein ShyY1